jgi:hypothetical protein
MTEKKYPYGSRMIGGREIPLTKSGLPNRVYLSKVARVVVKDFEDKLKGQTTNTTQKDYNDFLNDLGLLK